MLLTRPRAQAAAWVQRLQALGQPAAALPLIEVAPAADSQAVRDAAAQLASSALAMFVSPSAVACWRGALPADWAWPAGVWAGATGPGTVAALQRAGVPDKAIVAPPASSPHFDSEALWACLQPLRPWAGARVQVVRGEGGRDWFAEAVRQAGAEVQFVQAYRRSGPQLRADEAATLAQALALPQAHAWLFSSSEAAGHLPALAPCGRWRRSLALATHPRIAEAAQALGFERVLRISPSPEAVVAALVTAAAAAAGGGLGRAGPKARGERL